MTRRSGKVALWHSQPILPRIIILLPHSNKHVGKSIRRAVDMAAVDTETKMSWLNLQALSAFVFAMLIAGTPSVFARDTVKILTEEFPPYNFPIAAS